MSADEEFDRRYRAAQEELGRYPGVVGVAYGVKRRGGVPTGEIGFCVYVEEKKPLADLAPGERLPAEFRGVPVDVDPVPTGRRIAECQDRDTHSPLIGGITISNLLPVAGGYEAGTLGCFATLDGVDAPDNVVALTNHHVVMVGGATVGATIHQPRKRPLPTGQLALDTNEGRGNPIGRIQAEGAEKNVPFTYPNEAPGDYFVDCSAVRIHISMSSWCHTNCGESVRNEIRGLAVGGSSAIADVARVEAKDVDPPAPPYIVVKVGSRSSRTQGRVSRLDVPMKHGERQIIEITAVEDNCEGNRMFADHGDSGSALVNADRKLIGLVFAVDDADPTLTYACHIHPVMDLLKVTPITDRHPPDPRVTRSDADLLVDDRPSRVGTLKEGLLASAEGRVIAALVEHFRYEVATLVNTNRRVTIAWRRHHGPAFLNRAVANARDPGVLIPREIDGVTRDELLLAMDRALAQHGSPGLRAALDAHRGLVHGRADALDDLHRLVATLAAEEAVSEP